MRTSQILNLIGSIVFLLGGVLWGSGIAYAFGGFLMLESCFPFLLALRYQVEERKAPKP